MRHHDGAGRVDEACFQAGHLDFVGAESWIAREGGAQPVGEEPDEEMLAKCQDIAREEFANQATLEDENSY